MQWPRDFLWEELLWEVMPLCTWVLAPCGVLLVTSSQFTSLSWGLAPSLGHVYSRCLFSMSPFSQLQDTTGQSVLLLTTNGAGSAQGLWLPWQRALLNSPQQTRNEWMAGSTLQIKRGLCNYLLNLGQDFFFSGYFPEYPHIHKFQMKKSNLNP